jgi:hypothetical protein
MHAAVITLIAISLSGPATAPGEEKGAAPGPAVSLVLGPCQATAVPERQGAARTGGGNIHVTQPSPDTISVTMTGAAAARGHPLKRSEAGLQFDLAQDFEVVVHAPRVKRLRLVLWGRAIGLLRSGPPCGTGAGRAWISLPGRASVECGPAHLLGLDMPAREVFGGQNLSVHDRAGPYWVDAAPGKYALRQAFGISAAHEKAWFGKPAAAEFAPEPALEEEWLGKKEPFHGAAKKEFGFQVILKVIADEDTQKKGN